jgi:hypothetical protein
MLATTVSEFMQTKPYLTTILAEVPTVSASGSSANDYPVDAQDYYFDHNFNLEIERISKKVDDPTYAVYDLFQHHSIEFQKVKRYNYLQERIKIEYEKNYSYLAISEDEFYTSMNILIENISKLNYSKISVELSPQNEIKFKSILTDDTILILTKPLEKLGKDNPMIFYSVFINKKSVLNDYKNIEELVEGLNQFMQ